MTEHAPAYTTAPTPMRLCRDCEDAKPRGKNQFFCQRFGMRVGLPDRAGYCWVCILDVLSLPAAALPDDLIGLD